MKVQSTIALLLAAVFAFAAYTIYENPDKLRESYHSLSNECKLENKYCVALLSPLRVLADTAFDIKRKQISLNELPILRIYMSDGALKKLQEKRQTTLAQKRPILLSENDDWVRAKILSNNGKGEHKSNVQLRLKGDWADHLRNSDKLSFRIKVRNKEKIFGMSKFSIQAPSTRSFQYEPMLLNMMRQLGVLAPRYYFVDVRINDMNIGIMALEEHFTKQLVESQHRREGPIVAFDEDMIWRQRYLNNTNNTSGLHYSNRDLPIKVFRAGKFKPGSVRTQHNIRAISLLRDFMDGIMPAADTFDADKLSRWWIIINMWNGLHGAIAHNLRFYFNPVSGRLEPIAFDNGTHPRNRESIINSVASNALSQDLHFRKKVLKNLRVITDLIISPDFEQKFNRQQQKYLSILKLDGIKINKLSIDELRLNLATLIRKVEKNYNHWPPTPKNKTIEKKSVRKKDPIQSISNLSNGAELFTHLRSFAYWYPERTEIELKNLTRKPVSIISVYFKGKSDQNLWTGIQEIPVYKEGNNNHIQTASITSSNLNFNTALNIKYRYNGKIYDKPVQIQFRDYKTGYIQNNYEWYKTQGVIVKKHGKTIVFPPGHYSVDKNISTEQDWKVVFLAGTELTFNTGARMRINGPLYSLGSAESPVIIKIESSENKGLLGSWGGILVSQSERKSYVNHTQINGQPFTGLNARQDSDGITGCVTFHQSDVLIKNSLFLNLQCEDALNIVNSAFTFDHIKIKGSFADAFDSDFSTGLITRSNFTNIGNDGVDVSGSKVTIESSIFSGIADKAVSVGEKSHLKANEIQVHHAKSGVVSKDDSLADINNSSFSDISGTALFTYVKKAEYGPATLHCNNCKFDGVNTVSAEQFGNTIKLNGVDVKTTPFSRKQLHAADYIK